MPLIPVLPVEKPAKGQPVVYPEARDCFLVGYNGLFRHVDNPYFMVRYKTDKIPVCGEITEEVKPKVYKLPLEMFKQVESFFALVNTKFKGEAVVVLAWSVARKSWAVKIPKQQTRGLHVSYDASAGNVLMVYQDDKGELQSVALEPGQPVPEVVMDYENFGTIHSHCNASAFHSGTDDKDEFSFDGLHITIGKLDQPVREYAVRWIFAGRAYKSSIEHVVELPVNKQLDSWVDQVSETAPPPIAVPATAGVYVNGHFTGNGGYQMNTAPLFRGEGQPPRENFLSPREQMLREEAEERSHSQAKDLTWRERWDEMVRENRPTIIGQLKPTDPGYALEKFFKTPLHHMSESEARLYDALETDPWLEEDLQDNELCLMVQRDADLLDYMLMADDDRDIPPEASKERRKQLIEEIKAHAG
jgi:hypothetical protein